MAENKIDGMIFDVDGTLWDSTGIVEKAWNKAVKDSNIKGISISADDLKGLFGLPMDDIIYRIMPDESEETRKEFKPLCFSYEHEFLEREPGTLYPDLEKTLKALSEKIPLFVVSNCQAGYIELFYRKTGFEKYFKDHVCPGDTGLLKADNIKLIKEKYGLHHPVYIGDTHMDEEACRKAGVPFVFASYGFGHGIKPDHTIKTLPELVDLL